MAYFAWLNSWQRRLAGKPGSPTKARRNRLRVEVLEDRNLLSGSSTVSLLGSTGIAGIGRPAHIMHFLGSELETLSQPSGSSATAPRRIKVEPAKVGTPIPISSKGTIGPTG